MKRFILSSTIPDSKYSVTSVKWGDFGSTSNAAADVTV